MFNNKFNKQQREAQGFQVGEVVSHIYDSRARIQITSMPVFETDRQGYKFTKDGLIYGREGNGPVRPFLACELVARPIEQLEDMGMDWNDKDEQRWSGKSDWKH